MASVVQGTSNGNYDLARGLRLYDTSGDLPERARAICGRMIQDDGIEMAREFWRRYARSPEVREPIDDAKIEQLADRHRPLHRQQVRAPRPARMDPPGARLCRARARQRPDPVDPARRRHRRDRGRLRRDPPQGHRRGRADPPRAHPVRNPGDRDRRFIHHAITITRAESEQDQSRQAADFNSKVLGVVQNCTRESDQLRAQADHDLVVGARHARQDQRSRRRRRTVGGRDARSGADRRRPDPRDRGRPHRSRGRRRRRHPRRRPGRARRSRSARRCRAMSRRSNRSSA